MSFQQKSIHEILIEGKDTSVTVKKTSNTDLLVNWTLSKNINVTNGFIVLLSDKKFTPADYPENGAKYIPSSNFAVPASKINDAQVVEAKYGYFNDDLTVTSVTVSNVDPTKIYYASIHVCTNVLQYYSEGVQSYLLESNNTSVSDTFPGNIPESESAPLNPVNGQVYFNKVTNSILVWNDSLAAWIKSHESTVLTSNKFLIEKGKAFFNYTDNQLKIFDGSWVISTPVNTRIKMGAAWAPFTSASTVSSLPPLEIGRVCLLQNTVTVGINASTYTLYVGTLGGWQLFSQDLIQYNNGLNWINVAENADHGSADPIIPKIGDFLNNTTTNKLYVWDSANWVEAETENKGSPTSDKIGIGNSGSLEARSKLIKILKHQLGYPSQCVELSEESFNIAIDNSLDEFRRRADNAYSHRHISIKLKKGQSTYYLNDPRLQTDKIVSIIKVHRLNVLGGQSINSIYAQPYFTQILNGQMMDLTSIFLFNQMSDLFNKIFAGDLMFTWDEITRNLLILRNINTDETVVLEVALEKTEQELLQDRWAKQWIQQWSEAECLEMLGLIRTKYSNLPGPGGGLTLNGEQLLSMAAEKQTECLRQITDYEVGNGTTQFGNTGILIG